jgi:hypothetical protein
MQAGLIDVPKFRANIFAAVTNRTIKTRQTGHALKQSTLDKVFMGLALPKEPRQGQWAKGYYWPLTP